MTREVSRQAFVRGVFGVIAAGALGSCGTTDGPAPQGTPEGSRATTATSGPPDWAGLGGAIDGQVILPSSGEYATAKGIFNTRFDGMTPAAVVAVKSSGDLQKTVAFAAKYGVKIAARSGGHSYIGASAADGAMVIDLRLLPGDVTYDDTSALVTIPAATQLNSVHTALAAHARSIPTGSCPTVGVAGLTLGGGLGDDARRFGLTCDALVSAAVVLPTGETVTASQSDHADLYWALRGGGGGNCGVTTSFTFRTFPIGGRDVVSLTFPEQAAAQTIFGWHNWIAGADRAIWGMVNLTAGPNGLRCGVTLVTATGGGSQAAGDLGAAVGVQPISKQVRTLDHLALVDYFTGGDQARQPRAFVAGSDVVGEMTTAAAESIVAAASAWPGDMGSATVVVESLSGAVSEIDPGDTAFPWRRQAASVQWYVETPSQAAIDAANQWLSRAHEAVRANSVGAYVNYVEPNTPAARYFGGNLGRLAAIRQMYDPGALMHSGLDY